MRIFSVSFNTDEVLPGRTHPTTRERVYLAGDFSEVWAALTPDEQKRVDSIYASSSEVVIVNPAGVGL